MTISLLQALQRCLWFFILVSNAFSTKSISWLLLAFVTSATYAAPNEFWYQKVWCEGKGGIVEKKLDDGRRVDCITQTHAIEMDFASKWPEAIGQSLDYSMLTGKKAGIVLIIRRPDDLHHWQRLQKVVDHYRLPISLWKLGP